VKDRRGSDQTLFSRAWHCTRKLDLEIRDEIFEFCDCVKTHQIRWYQMGSSRVSKKHINVF
jgi:hypothetical protein